MKRILLSIPFVLFSTISLQAQTTLDYGVKIGANLSNVNWTITPNPVLTTPDTDYGFGYQAGLWLKIPVLSQLDFRSELSYSHERYRIPDSTGLKAVFNYLDLDLLVAYSPFKTLRFEFGPGFSKLLSAKQAIDDREVNFYDIYKKGLHMSLNLGVMLDLNQNFSI